MNVKHYNPQYEQHCFIAAFGYNPDGTIDNAALEMCFEVVA